MKRLNNLTDLAALLRSVDNSPTSKGGFDMVSPRLGDWTDHPCGTACCIGGWVQTANPQDTAGLTLGLAVKSLQPDLDYYECDMLCYPPPGSGAYNATPEQAARAVEILRDTGKCDWVRAMKEGAV